MELSNNTRIIWPTDIKLTTNEIENHFEDYLASPEFNLLQQYDNYYEGENTFIVEKVIDKKRRDKTPNNLVPTAYYSTIVDTMAGFMFADVQYLPKDIKDKQYAKDFNDILDNNNSEVKEMETGTYSLAFNKGIELIYTVGDGENPFDIKYTSIDPRQSVLIYDNKIEPDVFCMIWVRVSGNVEGKTQYLIDVIYKDEWQYYKTVVNPKTKKRELEQTKEHKELFFDECPVAVYVSNNMSIRSPFHKIIKYINALDFLITGNANDIESLTDAILVLTKILEGEDLRHLNELKAIMEVEPEDRAEFLTKNADPAFREYASKLLIREIHKHSHTVDYFSPDTGLTGEVSGKALRIRLFDMNTYSQKIEKIYRLGVEKKVRLITSLMNAKIETGGDLNIVYKRTIPDEFEEIAPILNQLMFISDRSKLERLGFNVEEELKKMKEQKEANIERVKQSFPDGMSTEDPEDDQEETE